jgi:predicted negative regulator of RcsB-dependent stress response
MKPVTKSIFVFGTAILGLAAIATARADLDLPDVSQLAVNKQRVGLTDITITYHRPLVNGRKIWGGLVPLGDVWRAGANQNTTIEFSEPVSVEGKALAKGIYGLHMIPTADNWTVIFSKMSSAWGSYTYKQDEDALRVTVKPRPTEMEEALEYEFEDLKPDSATITMKWEKLAVPFNIAINDAEGTMANIRNQMRGRAQYEWEAPNQAAQFCLNKKINLDEALKWVDLSIQNEERFENLTTKADLFKATNKPDEAKKAWEKALAKTTAQQLYSYARRLKSENKDTEAMEILKDVGKRYPDTVFAYLANARVKSAAGDFAGAAEDAKKAQAAAPSEQQKNNIKLLIDRLQAKQDINK